MLDTINIAEKNNEEIIKDLEAKKAEAVESDNFEEAIKIRDQIKELKSKETIEESKSDISEKVDQIEVNTEEHKKEMDNMKTKADEEKNSKMDDLMWQLNDEKDNTNSEKKEEIIENKENVGENKELIKLKKGFIGSFDGLRNEIWNLYLSWIKKTNNWDPDWTFNKILHQFNDAKTAEELYPLGKKFLHECIYQIQQTNKKMNGFMMNKKILDDMIKLYGYLFNNTKDKKTKEELKEVGTYIKQLNDVFEKHMNTRVRI